MENSNCSLGNNTFVIRFDDNEPLHKSTLNLYYMLTEMIDIEIECQPMYNCTKSIREFLTAMMPFENDQKLSEKTIPDFQLPFMVFTSRTGKRKVECTEPAILRTLIDGTRLAITDHLLDNKWLPFAKKIRTLMSNLIENVFDELLANKTQDVIMLHDVQRQVELDEILDKLETTLLQSGNDFLTGNQVSIADVIVICELFPTFGQIEKSARDLRVNYTNVLCWLKRMNAIYSIRYVLRQSVDLYPNEDFHRPARLKSPLLPTAPKNDDDKKK